MRDDQLVYGGACEIDVHAYAEVCDLEGALRFYVGGLGLREFRRLTPSWVELAGARVPIHLLLRDEPCFRAGAATLRREFGRHWTPVHLGFVVDDLEGAVQRAVTAFPDFVPVHTTNAGFPQSPRTVPAPR